MSDYDSNYNSICCPYCGERIFDNKYCLGAICSERGISDLEDEEEDFFECLECGRSFKVELRVYKEYDYIITEPTKEEINRLQRVAEYYIANDVVLCTWKNEQLVPYRLKNLDYRKKLNPQDAWKRVSSLEEIFS